MTVIDTKVRMRIDMEELDTQIETIGRLIDTTESMTDSEVLEGTLNLLTSIKDVILDKEIQS